MRILLVEPYLTGSHRAWAEGYQANSRHDVEILAHPGRFWKWRMAGASVTLADRLRSRPDVVLATDMLDVPAFLGAARRRLAGVPVAVYFHESQLFYPPSPDDRTFDAMYPLINWRSAHAADLVVFNSDYHRDAFFEALPRFLRSFPDERHLDLIADVEHRSVVWPVGVDLGRIRAARPPALAGEGPVVLWNQRWEHDKDPEALVRVLDRVVAQRRVRLVICGEEVRNRAPELEAARERWGDAVVHFGFAPEEHYPRLVAAADIVVSTSRQESFGIAVVEAIAGGAFPVLPDRLVYPERVGAEGEWCLYGDEDDAVRKIVWAIDHPDEAQAVTARLQDRVAGFDWSAVAPAYDTGLEALVAGQSSGNALI